MSDYIDEVAVERAAKGDLSVALTRAEAEEAWRVLEGRRLGAEEIGRRMGVTERTVTRWRSGELHPKARERRTS